MTGQSGDGYPEGTVTLYYGTTPVALCSETLPAGSGDSAGFSCSLTASQLDVGTYSSVDAVFAPAGTSSSNPDFTYTTSTSSPTQSFTVDPASEPTTTSLNAVTSPITFGSETTESFSGTVTGQSGDGYPEGTVTLYYGTTPVALCSETLPAGSGDSAGFSCSLTASPAARGHLLQRRRRLRPGGHLVVEPRLHLHHLDLEPDPELHGQQFGDRRAHHHVAQRGHLADHLRTPRPPRASAGTVTGQSGDGYPEGTVTLYYGTTPVALCSETLPAGSGDSAGFSCSLTASQLDVGTYSSVDAVFAPAGTSSSNARFTYTTSTSSPTQSFTVNQPTGLSTSLSTLLSGGGQSGTRSRCRPTRR